MSGNIVEHITEKIPVNEREIWRYAGYAGIKNTDEEMATTQVKDLLSEVMNELEGTFSFRICHRAFPITWENSKPVLPFEHQSQNLATCLAGSTEGVMFAATIGHEIDRKIQLYNRISPTKALLMQAYGAERVESLCNYFCENLRAEYAKKNLVATPRYSPGYGDLPIEIQKDFFRKLDIYHLIGISLGDSYLMKPSKSVTAIIGFKPPKDGETGCTFTEKSCETCPNKNCSFRE